MHLWSLQIHLAACAGCGKHSSSSNITAFDVEMDDVNHRGTAKGGDRAAGVSCNGTIRNGVGPDMQSLFSMVSCVVGLFGIMSIQTSLLYPFQVKDQRSEVAEARAQLATKDTEHKAELLRVEIRLWDKYDAERAGLA